MPPTAMLYNVKYLCLLLVSFLCDVMFSCQMPMFLFADEILYNADVEDIAFLVVGDPFGFVLNCFCQL